MTQKTATRLSKPIKHSKIITQTAETAVKLNSVDIESATIEHPKTVTNFSKAIKLL